MPKIQDLGQRGQRGQSQERNSSAGFRSPHLHQSSRPRTTEPTNTNCQMQRQQHYCNAIPQHHGDSSADLGKPSAFSHDEILVSDGLSKLRCNFPTVAMLSPILAESTSCRLVENVMTAGHQMFIPVGPTEPFLNGTRCEEIDDDVTVSLPQYDQLHPQAP